MFSLMMTRPGWQTETLRRVPSGIVVQAHLTGEHRKRDIVRHSTLLRPSVAPM